MAHTHIHTCTNTHTLVSVLDFSAAVDTGEREREWGGQWRRRQEEVGREGETDRVREMEKG